MAEAELETIDLNARMTEIKKQACFKDFYEEETAELATLLTEKTFKAGETIVNEGDEVDCVYLIVKGQADVFTTKIENKQFNEVHVAVLSEGDAIGLSATGFYSLTGLRTATVIAKTDIVALRLGVAVFRGFTLAHSHAYDVMRKQSESK